MSRFDDDVVMGSERSFGRLVAIVFFVIAILPLWSGDEIRLWALITAAMVFAITFFWPRALRPFNIAWFRFGLLLGRVTTPIMLAIVYLLTVLPIGLAMRFLGKDTLRRSREPSSRSYWIRRDAPGPEKGSMKRQF